MLVPVANAVCRFFRVLYRADKFNQTAKIIWGRWVGDLHHTEHSSTD
jgi:hypothetical protein